MRRILAVLAEVGIIAAIVLIVAIAYGSRRQRVKPAGLPTTNQQFDLYTLPSTVELRRHVTIAPTADGEYIVYMEPAEEVHR